ncbi:MAG: CheR family methyltransferase [Bacillota bacterium]|jgi:chemotaxis protein methyltransferase CheR
MDFNNFKDNIARQFGLNLQGYKEQQLKRRIDSLMLRLQVDDYRQYFQMLVRNEELWHGFLDKITINVSEFFRNPEIFALLEKEILPKILAAGSYLKIWSAACSNGSEPYSVAIILAEIAPATRYQLDASDIDAKILAQARQGKYPPQVLKNVSESRLTRYFTSQNGFYFLKEQIKRKVSFKHHDLLTETYGTGYDLIICRNVTIYFTREMQLKLYRQFHRSLKSGGVLFIGATESILSYRELGYEKIYPWFYRKI